MNKTFKVIFSRTRDGFVVANEITRSAKKTGGKVLFTLASLTLVSSAHAWGISLGNLFHSSTGSTDSPAVVSEETSTAKYAWSSSTESTGFSFAEAWKPAETGVAEFRGIEMQEGATGTAENISITIDADQPTDKNTFSSAVYGIYNAASSGTKASGPSFAGEKLTVTVDSEFTGNVAAIKASNNTYIAAGETTLTATSLKGSVYGLYVTGSQKTVEVAGAATITSKLTADEANSLRAYGLYQDGKNTVKIGAAGKNVSISVIANQQLKWDDAISLQNGATSTLIGKEIRLSSIGTGLYVTEGSTASVGDKATDLIAIDTDQTGIRASSSTASTKSTVTLNAATISIDSEEEGIAFGTVDEGVGNSEISLNATTIQIDSKNTALEVLSTGSTLNLTASDSIRLQTENGAGLEIDDANSTARLTAKTIYITAQKEDVLAVTAGSATLKADDTISLISTDPNKNSSNSEKKWDHDTTVLAENSAEVLLEAGTLVIQHENHLPVTATEETSSSDATSADEDTASNSGPKHAIEVTPSAIDSEETSSEVTLTGVGIGSYSGAKLTIKAATEIDATTAIHVSGGSTTKINTDATRKTTIAGDIVFDSNANLNIALSGSDSSFTGRAYQTYKSGDATRETVSLKGIAGARDAVTGFALKVADDAKWVLTEGASFVNRLTLSNGGAVDATKATVFNAGSYNATTGKTEAGITVEGSGNTLTLGETTEADVTIEMAEGSELVTPLSTAFKLTKEALTDVVTDAVNRLTVTLKEGAKSAAITINDAFTVTTEAFAKMNAEYSNVTLNLVNMKLETVASSATEAGPTQFTNDASLGSLTGNGDFTVAAGKNLTLSGSGATSEINTLSLAGASGSSSKLMLTNGTKAKVSEIVGSGSGAVELSEASDLAVGAIHDVEAVSLGEGSTLTLGTAGEATESKVGKISLSSGAAGATLRTGNQTKVKVDAIEGTGTIQIAEDSELDVKKLSGASKITVGDVGGKGATLSVEKLEMHGGSLFLDPLYGHTTATLASFGSEGLDTNVSVGSGALVILGSTSESVAREKISAISAIANSESALYVATPVNIASAGSIVVDSNLTEADTGYAGMVAFRNDATLVIDQAAVGSANVFAGGTNFGIFVGGTLNIGIVNASQGLIELGSEIRLDGGSVSLYTDSPFLTASLDNATGSITLAQTVTDDALSAVTSMGVQTMIRNADAVLAETIADRVAAAETGNGLWVTVRGERFKQTSLGNGAGFSANVGYGAFGAEFNPTENTNLGVAFQYGHGTVKGKVYGVKNKTKDYGVALYGSVGLGETGIKLLGEVAYTQSKNDITNNYYTGLNQDLDAKMISGGVTVQKTFEAGSVNVTPSVGARVSRINTDAMRAGAARIEKQKQTLVQVPVAVRVAAKAIETTSGWTITPHAKVAYVPTFGDKEINIFGVEKTVIDTSPVQGAFGVGFKKGNCSIDATAHVGAGKKGSSVVGAKLGLTYRF